MTEQTMTDIPTPPDASPPRPARPPLRRSSDRVIGGVAGGIARWLDIDPTIVRVVLVVLAVFGGSGLLLYAIGWLLIPAEGSSSSSAQQLLDRSGRPGSANRVLLIVLGVCLAALAVGWLGAVGTAGGLWDPVSGGTLLLLAAGGLVAWLVARDGRAGRPPSAEPVPPVPPAAAPVAAVPPTPVGFAYGGSGGGYTGYTPTPSVPPVPPAPRRPRSYLGLAAVSLAVLVMGAMTSMAVTDVVAIPAVVILATGLGILGLAIVVGAFAGRATWLLVLAIPLLLVVSLVATVPSNVLADSTIGDVTWRPATATQAAQPHRILAGEAVLDLRDLPAGTGLDGPITARVGFGSLIVLLPADRAFDVDASVGGGEIQVEGARDEDGMGRTVRVRVPAQVPSTVDPVDLDLEVGFGTVEVSRG